ncbi:MAG TPA: hypothetical protein VMF89_34650, partial [Polyangiales bacterium]|nr:hypothetical protein [Polyangiales bacterium]
TAACTIAPEPPATPRAVLQLSEHYDQPTARLDQSTADQLFGTSIPDYAELKTLAGLSFVRGVIAKALKTPSIDEVALGLDVQGSLAVHAMCPGWEPKSEVPDPEAGYVDFVVGVDESRVQRAFVGSVTECRFIAGLAGERTKVQASMELEVDLGRSLALGDAVPPILLSATQLSAELSVPLSTALTGDGVWAMIAAELAPDGLALDLDTASRRWSLRIAGEDLVETLLDLDEFDIGANGTILLGLRDDGTFNLRDRDSEWNCGGDGSVLCVRSD